MHDLLVYVKEGLSFPRDFRKLFRKRNGFLFVFLTGVNSFIVSILFRQSITVFVFVLGFSLLNFFTQTVNFLTLIPSCVSHNPALLDLFLPHDPSICSAVIFPYWEIVIKLVSQFLLTFLQTQKRMPLFIARLMTVLVLMGTVFVII